MLVRIYWFTQKREKKSKYDRLRSASGLKSASTDIISNHGPIKGYTQIGILSKFSDLWPIYWLELGHTSVTSLDIDLRKWKTAILRNGRRFENLWKGHRFWNWRLIGEFEGKKKDIDLRYRCLWRRNRTWVWGLDVD